MTIFPWMWLLAIDVFLDLICPVSFKFMNSNLLGIILLFFRILFLILVPFFAPSWKYLLAALGITFFVMAITPSIINPPQNKYLQYCSSIGHLVRPVILLFMYISLLKSI